MSSKVYPCIDKCTVEGTKSSCPPGGTANTPTDTIMVGISTTSTTTSTNMRLPPKTAQIGLATLQDMQRRGTNANELVAHAPMIIPGVATLPGAVAILPGVVATLPGVVATLLSQVTETVVVTIAACTEAAPPACNSPVACLTLPPGCARRGINATTGFSRIHFKWVVIVLRRRPTCAFRP